MLSLLSPAFAHNTALPRRFTAEGGNVSPPLRWRGAPLGTRSFALIVEDPDAPDPRAPQCTWSHWVLYGIPADTRSLPENAAVYGLPPGARQGLNDWRCSGYGGPAPPIGRHRYFHRLYALDTLLVLENPSRSRLLAAMKNHVLDRATLIGTYEMNH